MSRAKEQSGKHLDEKQQSSTSQAKAKENWKSKTDRLFSWARMARQKQNVINKKILQKVKINSEIKIPKKMKNKTTMRW